MIFKTSRVAFYSESISIYFPKITKNIDLCNICLHRIESCKFTSSQNVTKNIFSTFNVESKVLFGYKVTEMCVKTNSSVNIFFFLNRFYNTFLTSKLFIFAFCLSSQLLGIGELNNSSKRVYIIYNTDNRKVRYGRHNTMKIHTVALVYDQCIFMALIIRLFQTYNTQCVTATVRLFWWLKIKLQCLFLTKKINV